MTALGRSVLRIRLPAPLVVWIPTKAGRRTAYEVRWSYG